MISYHATIPTSLNSFNFSHDINNLVDIVTNFHEIDGKNFTHFE
jgi:hypothetical protein